MATSIEINRANWNERAAAHAASPDYGFEQFVADPGHLSDVVRFDLPLLGDITGLQAVHLQCHIGTDTLSLARLGAQLTGLDFSPAALIEARRLAAATDTDITYVEAEVYDAVSVLGAGKFDLVFTGIGALCWLPDIRRWADVVAGLLRPGGRLFVREGHPMMWALADPEPDGRLIVEYPYFAHGQPTIWQDGGTYVDTDTTFTATESHSWNHGLGQVITAVQDAGLTFTSLTEHDSVPWEGLPNTMVSDGKEWRLRDRPLRVPLSYTLRARKPG